MVTALRARHVVAEEMSAARLDGALDAMGAFPDEPPRDAAGEIDHAALPTEAIRVRRWGERRASMKDLHMDQVVGLRRALPKFLRVAYEIEDPWRAYTLESMGYMENAGLRKMTNFMDAVWQADERRHGAYFRAAYLAVTGEKDIPPNPHVVDPVLPGVPAVERHFYMRIIAELGASAGYTVYGVVTRDDLQGAMLNVAGDEYRHLAVFWAALKWRFGSMMALRLLKVAQTSAFLGMKHNSNRTGLKEGVTVEDAVMVGRIGLTMANIIARLLVWDVSLTRSRLQDVFGPVPKAPALLTH